MCMKYSIYNSLIKLSEKTSLLYNSLSDNFLLFKNSICFNGNIESIKEKNPNLWNLMVRGDFMVEESKDELEVVKIIRNNVDLNNSFFHLIINPTLSCNFKCWYCYETHLKKSVMDEGTVNNTIKLISNISKNVSNLSLGFFGGEPLLYYEKVVKPLIIHASECCRKSNSKLSISFTTNGYLINNEMVDFFKKYLVSSFQITLDGGKEEHDKTRYPSVGKGSYLTIINNIKLLLENGFFVLLRINSTDKNIFSTQEIANDLKDITTEMKALLEVRFYQVWQNAKVSDIDCQIDDMINIFSLHKIKAGMQTFNNVKQPCYGDKKNSLIVNYNGDVFKCTAVDFAKTKRDGFLDENGQVFWENDSLNIRLNSKFHNKSCLSCRILPICNGACSQKALEYKDQDYCILSYDEQKKDNAILGKFKHNILSNPDWQIL